MLLAVFDGGFGNKWGHTINDVLLDRGYMRGGIVGFGGNCTYDINGVLPDEGFMHTGIVVLGDTCGHPVNEVLHWLDIERSDAEVSALHVGVADMLLLGNVGARCEPIWSRRWR